MVVSNTYSRRKLLLGALGLSVTGLLAACGGDDDDDDSGDESAPTATSTEVATTATEDVTETETETPTEEVTEDAAEAATDEPSSEAAEAEAGDGEWSFTDGRGVTVTLPQRPERIVTFTAAAGALWDYGIRPVGVFGQQKLGDGSIDPSLGNADPEQMTSIGETNDAFDLEALLTLEPDLVISTMNTANDIWGIGAEDADNAIELVEQIAPVLAMSAFFEPIDALISHFEELAVALGGDPSTPEATELRDGFTAVSEQISTIAQEKPELSVIVCTGNNENFFFADTTLFPDLIYLNDLGINFVIPEGIQYNGPWGGVSWEQVGQYSADVFLIDERRGWPPAGFMEQEVFTRLPAIANEQYGRWSPLVPLSYGGMTPLLQRHADLLAAADASLAE